MYVRSTPASALSACIWSSRRTCFSASTRASSGSPARADLGAQLLHLLAVDVAVAQLALDLPELLAQVVVALGLRHLLARAVLDLRLHLQDADLLLQRLVDAASGAATGSSSSSSACASGTFSVRFDATRSAIRPGSSTLCTTIDSSGWIVLPSPDSLSMFWRTDRSSASTFTDRPSTLDPRCAPCARGNTGCRTRSAGCARGKAPAPAP